MMKARFFYLMIHAIYYNRKQTDSTLVSKETYFQYFTCSTVPISYKVDTCFTLYYNLFRRSHRVALVDPQTDVINAVNC